MHIIGRGRYARETYQARNNGSASSSSGVEGWDTVREPIVVPALATIAEAAAAPALPRDGVGTPLSVALGAWVSGDYLRVDWAGSAGGTLSAGAFGLLVPRVTVGANPTGYIDNGSQFGLVGVPGNLMYAFGSTIIQLNTTDTVTVELGLVLVQGAPGDALQIAGGPISLVFDAFVLGSTWMRAARVPASEVVSAPPASIVSLPIPS